MKKRLIFLIFLLSISVQVQAQTEWIVVPHTDTDTGLQTSIATMKNEAGYKIEIYIDSNDAVRKRFSIRDGHDLLATKQCPTFQVDKNKSTNRSTNNATCISQPRWAEYILGYISHRSLYKRLSPLYSIIHGDVIYFRFLLKDGGYAQTLFSLHGSNKAVHSALGKNLFVVNKMDNGF